MRKLNRNKIIAPAILTDKNGAGAVERNNAITAALKFIDSGNGTAAFNFKYKIYRDPVVKQTVSDMSFNKCAYCEIDVSAGFDGDVEHFRPKGAVLKKDGTLQKPAYYWLASEWDNLFLSCDHCNKGRKRKGSDGKIVTSGKQNQFPLTDERKRLRRDTQKVKDEEPYQLLIDPCKWDPQKHLQFSEDGVVKAKNSKTIWGKRAQKTIEVFALYRNPLVKARARHAKTIRNAIESYNDFLRNYNRCISDGAPKAEQIFAKNLLQNQINRLKLYIEEDQPFSSLSYQLLKNEIQDFPY
jgi:uncharacterized protein (TIGR02646 family)